MSGSQKVVKGSSVSTSEMSHGDRFGYERKSLSAATGAKDSKTFEEYYSGVIIGGEEKRRIILDDYDPGWAKRFESERYRVESALGNVALAVEHIGSTSVPGLAAKPVVDMLLVVADSSDENSYLPKLEEAGYVLRVREPDLDEHRMLRTPEKDVHLHVFTEGSVEIERYLLLRERLRTNEYDRNLYERTKRELAAKDWPSMNHYADAKSEVVEGIISRAAEEKGEAASTYTRSWSDPGRGTEPQVRAGCPSHEPGCRRSQTE